MKSFSIVLTGLLAFVLLGSSQPAEAPQFSFGERYLYSLANNDVIVYALEKRRREMGTAVWISRASKRVNAKYFAYENDFGNVYSRLRSWKDDNEVIVACAGAYSTGDGKPDGLTVDNGTIVNRSLSEDKDALVIIYATGGVVVSDIDEGNLELGGIGKVNLRKSSGRTRLLNWVASQNATMFQTHLLAYRDRLRISTSGRTERANRRILALATDEYENLYHVIFDLQDNNYYLYDAAKDVMEYLDEKEMEVIAMMNFDTGSYDIFQLYDEDGDVKNSQSGLMPISKATNLLTYHIKQ